MSSGEQAKAAAYVEASRTADDLGRRYRDVDHHGIVACGGVGGEPRQPLVLVSPGRR